MSSDEEEITTYTLWLIPGNPEFLELERLIYDNQRLAQEPAFIPHITLLSAIEPGQDLSDRFQSLCRLTPGFMLQCREPERGNDYFHCLFIPVVLSGQLKQLRNSAEQLFSVSRLHSFYPHVSLIYSNPRSRDVDELAKRLPDFSMWTLSISRLELWDTNGPVDKWELHFRAELPIAPP